jgi:Uma2 family endonuclease
MKVKEIAPRYLTQKKLLTYQDYLDLPVDGNRYEIINGELIMAPSPGTGHQDVSGNLEFALRKFLETHKVGKIYHAPIDVVLSEHHVLQPDILFIANERTNIITEKNISGPPDLIIEILSPSTGYYDLVEKKESYEKFGVPEYWMVDPKKQWVEIYFLEGSKFKLLQRLEKDGVLKSKVLKGFQIDFQNLFA